MSLSLSCPSHIHKRQSRGSQLQTALPYAPTQDNSSRFSGASAGVPRCSMHGGSRMTSWARSDGPGRCSVRIQPVLEYRLQLIAFQPANNANSDWINGEKTEDIVAFLDRLYTAKRKVEKRIVLLGGEADSVCFDRHPFTPSTDRVVSDKRSTKNHRGRPH